MRSFTKQDSADIRQAMNTVWSTKKKLKLRLQALADRIDAEVGRYVIEQEDNPNEWGEDPS